MRFDHVLVVGAGQMGAGIAQVVAASGRRVSLHDPFPGATERGLVGIAASLERLRRRAATHPRRFSTGSRSSTSSSTPTC